MLDTRARTVGLLLIASPIVVIAGLSIDARMRREERAREAPAIDLVAKRLPVSDLALSGGARWLRAPSVEEPSAAFADGPALPDPDPAGGAMAPPTEAWSGPTITIKKAGTAR